VPVRGDWRADVEGCRHDDDDTVLVMIRRSTPSVIDPIEESRARRWSHISCHVDACMGA
jgi:hypothetical protein